jgi:hypothetical protein
MNSKTWITLWIGTTLIIPLIALVNYIIDPFGMNNHYLFKGYNNVKKTNTVYTYRVKTNTIVNHQFDTLLLGTSRVGVMNPKVIDKYLKGKSFNFAIPASTTEIQYQIFLYNLKFNRIKNLIYGIDFMAFNQHRTIQKDFKDYAEVQKKIEKGTILSNYDLYFNLKTFKESLNLLYQNFLHTAPIKVRYLKSNGMRKFYDHEDAVKNSRFNMKKNIEESLFLYFNKDDGLYKEYQFSKNYLDYFKKTVNYCKENNIKTWVYIPPMHLSHLKELYAKGYQEEFEKFQRELVNVTNFIDFNGKNSITINDANYWDSSHLKSNQTDIIMKRLFNEKNQTTPQNIDQHLKELKKAIN